MKKINLFEYSLENGKKQLKQGLIFLIVNVLISCVWLLFRLIPSEKAQLAFTIIFSIALIIMGTLMIIKIVFGAIVYHAERTGGRRNS
ncbi:MAG: hypothetical protein ACOQNV_00920 [Mycoplasmoidaceae bacterium]